MQVRMVGPAAGAGPTGALRSWGPGELVDVDDNDTDTVAWYMRCVDAGSAELVVAPKTKGTAKAPASAELDIEDEGGADGEPPRSGPGSGKQAWVEYAESLGFDVTDDMTRDDIIAAIDKS